MDSLTTGQLAEAANVNVETVRYYEKRGLLPRPPRSNSGYRRYDQSSVKRLLFIKHAQELGFSLREIAELLSIQYGTGKKCGAVKKRTEAKIDEVERKIKNLQAIRGALRKLVGACRIDRRASECPILEALDAGTTGLTSAE